MENLGSWSVLWCRRCRRCSLGDPFSLSVWLDSAWLLVDCLPTVVGSLIPALLIIDSSSGQDLVLAALLRLSTSGLMATLLSCRLSCWSSLLSHRLIECLSCAALPLCRLVLCR